MPIPDDYKAPLKLSAKDKAYNQIQEWIIDGTMKPGEKILDSELSNALEISRTPIREALQLLCVQGFVEMKPGRETVVTEVCREGLKDILPPLAALQSVAGELAADYVDEKLIYQLKVINHDFENHVTRGDFYKALKSDEMFHMKIVKAAKNKYIWDMITQLQAHIRRYFFQESIPLSQHSVEEHNIIIDAFKNRDIDKITNTLKINWLRAIDEMKFN